MKLHTPKISFEFFPPKTPEGIENLSSTAISLANYHPGFMSVTFGAGGSTRSGTLETVAMLCKQLDVNIAPHLACIGITSREISEILAQYKLLGVKRLVALRGDIPSGMVNAGEFHYASDLVSYIRKETGDYFHIEVAAYPEIHPQAKTPSDDVLNLKRKFDAGANSAITQYFFNPDAYFYYLDECASLGIHLPVIPGIMPITQFSNLARFSDNCGAEIPRWMRKRLEAYSDDIESIRLFGLEVVTTMCEQLIAGGAPGLHFYTLNKDKPSIDVLAGLKIFGMAAGGVSEKVAGA